MTSTIDVIKKVAAAKSYVALLSDEDKAKALYCMADSIEANATRILEENAKDMLAAKDKISVVMQDRLALNEGRIKAMADGVRAVATLPDPTNRLLSKSVRADGLEINKISVPLGTVAIIYESRPNVTSDAAALCIRSGNACILRAGKEAHSTVAAIVQSMKEGLCKASVNPDVIGFVEDLSRQSATDLMTAKGYVDLLIPRGGAGLIKACVDNAKVPCIETGTGICHVYVDGAADLQKALKIIENAKCSRPSVCNAMEVCLIDKTIAQSFLPELYKRLVAERKINPVLLVLDQAAQKILGAKGGCVPAGECDFDTEFLDYKMAVKIVDGVDEAIAHIRKHSTGHSDCIVTEDICRADKFTKLVDSAAVYVNASTRFTDGGEFGLGCEMGISTQKLHARGPMGLEELTTYKYVVKGNGNIR